MSLKLYVWRGERVLRNYTHGMAIVAATSVGEAWEKLKQTDFSAWATMKLGIRYVYDERDLKAHYYYCANNYYNDGVDKNCKVEPEEFEPENLPSLVQHGGD
jgi:hypothetical protein